MYSGILFDNKLRMFCNLVYVVYLYIYIYIYIYIKIISYTVKLKKTITRYLKLKGTWE